MSKKGLIHVYTGEGKGKTTAAFGLAIRAAGHNKKVLIFQFLKGGSQNSGEAVAVKKFGIKIITFKDQISPLFKPAADVAKLKRSVKESLQFTLDEIKSDGYDMIILDEFNNLFGGGLATMKDAKKIIESKPDNAELVFTGRNAPDELVEMADYVTETRMIKHPFDKGRKARKGIEF
jgi:cob(I)alamin adenosyltransferase